MVFRLAGRPENGIEEGRVAVVVEHARDVPSPCDRYSRWREGIISLGNEDTTDIETGEFKKPREGMRECDIHLELVGRHDFQVIHLDAVFAGIDLEEFDGVEVVFCRPHGGDLDGGSIGRDRYVPDAPEVAVGQGRTCG
jgi:hypothetical protein